MDVTGWLRWFLACLDNAFNGAQVVLENVLRKARFWEALAGEKLNDRQQMMLNRLLEGFEGKLTSSKWARITKTSQTRLHVTSMIWSIEASFAKMTLAVAAQAIPCRIRQRTLNL